MRCDVKVGGMATGGGVVDLDYGWGERKLRGSGRWERLVVNDVRIAHVVVVIAVVVVDSDDGSLIV